MACGRLKGSQVGGDVKSPWQEELLLPACADCADLDGPLPNGRTQPKALPRVVCGKDTCRGEGKIAYMETEPPQQSVGGLLSASSLAIPAERGCPANKPQVCPSLFFSISSNSGIKLTLQPPPGSHLTPLLYTIVAATGGCRLQPGRCAGASQTACASMY